MYPELSGSRRRLLLRGQVKVPGFAMALATPALAAVLMLAASIMTAPTALAVECANGGIGPDPAGDDGGTAFSASRTACGQGATASGGSSSAYGEFSTASGESSSAFGQQSTASGGASSAYGFDSTASGSASSAFGQQSTASGDQSAAYGTHASATHENSAAFGADATTTRDNQQMFGTTTNTYTMAGVNSDDSRAAQSGPVNLVTTDGDGNLAGRTFDELGLASIGDIAGIQSQINGLIDRDDELAEGIAISLALDAPVLRNGQTFAMRGGWGNFEGSNAAGFTAAGALSQNVVVDAGVGWGTSQGTVAGKAGVTIGW
ncbi:hypothetical protein [Hyphomicrobium sp.]|uniref:hypothetical protein n=1 Tax=Hyphomicrobium sp. TaxID=82 RepID=UPI0025C3A760|nr:hypothetical protein [Hyphomicrobium sp.]MCC7253575.1 hypothetical protein [Hyphomicrobium sp.]